MSAPGAAPTAEPRFGEVYDRGYRHYEGPRHGQASSVWALARYSMARALGFKKSWTAKIIPILLYVGAILPVVVVVGVTAFFPAADVMSYPEYFSTIFLLEGIFVAAIAPELLCPDRREGVLPLYFSRPITRLDYVIAKMLAAAILTLTISLLPAVILWLGKQLLTGQPLAAMRDHLGDLGRIGVAGVLIAFYIGAVGLLVSSFTERKGVAVGIIVLGFLLTESLSGALSVALADRPPWDQWVILLSPSRTVFRMATALWGVEVSGRMGGGLPLGAVIGVMAAVVAVCCGIVAWRYAARD